MPNKSVGAQNESNASWKTTLQKLPKVVMKRKMITILNEDGQIIRQQWLF
jgi:hypothetical protein